MPHVFERLFKEQEYAYRHQALNEVTYRQPHDLSAFTTLTHIPLLNLSVEDTLFQSCTEELKTIIMGGKKAAEGLGLQGEDRKSAEHLVELLSIPEHVSDFENRYEEMKTWNDPKKDLFKSAYHELDFLFKTVIEAQPEYILFQCYSQVIQILHNRFTDTYRQPKYQEISKICEELVFWFHDLLRSNADAVRREVDNSVNRARVRIKTPDFNENQNDRLDLGGLISTFRGFNPNYQNVTPDSAPNQRRSFESDHAYIGLRSHHTVNFKINYLLRWYRSNQFWSYTFFQFCRRPLLPTDAGLSSEEVAKLGVPERQTAEMPFLTLGQQRDLGEYEKGISAFLWVILRFGVAPSLLNSPGLHAAVADSTTPFPGKLLAGAHYTFLPLGILVAILFFPQEVVRLAKEFMNELQPSSSASAQEFIENRNVTDAYLTKLQTLLDDNLTLQGDGDEYKNFIDEIKSIDVELFQTLTHCVTDRHVEMPKTEEFLRLGWRLLVHIDNDKSRSRKLSQSIARFCTDLWYCLHEGVNSPGTTAQTSGLGATTQDDFISCYVVGRRGLYFTNFFPIEDDRFTRTLFIDIGLTGYQRARLAERLCDISTYRSICVRDINRVRAMIRGLDEIGRDLNTFETEPRTDQLEDVEKSIPVLDVIQQRLDQMNLFVTYGVRGRMLSGKAFFDQIRERINDIRQKRIGGYPMLGDYLERRVAQGVRDVERMAERHDYLAGRVQAYYNAARTKLDSIQTLRIEKSSAGMDQTMTVMNKTLVGMDDTMEGMNKTLAGMNSSMVTMGKTVGVLENTTKKATHILWATEVLITLTLGVILYAPAVEIMAIETREAKAWTQVGLLLFVFSIYGILKITAVVEWWRRKSQPS